MQQPAAEEIEAQLSGRALTAVVFFLDETFEEIAWDMATTVADANMQLAGLIKLTNYETFTLFESRKVGAHGMCVLLAHICALWPVNSSSMRPPCRSDVAPGRCRCLARVRMGSRQALWRRQCCWTTTGAMICMSC